MLYNMVPKIGNIVLYTYKFVKMTDSILNFLNTVFKSYIAKVSIQRMQCVTNLPQELTGYNIWDKS